MPYWMLKLVGRAPPPIEEAEDEKSTDDVRSSGGEAPAKE